MESVEVVFETVTRGLDVGLDGHVTAAQHGDHLREAQRRERRAGFSGAPVIAAYRLPRANPVAGKTEWHGVTSTGPSSVSAAARHTA